ncbi:YceD family protein [Falsiroseomonas sp. CW058]|uniref:YceD family protein n=1 Tax=Falsiroseomonas sp. CW058 TaxID=3388664 RepID=UPI003D30F057
MTRPEFSRPHRLGPERRHIVLEATAGECSALAARFGILGVGALRAELDLLPESSGVVRVQGRLRAAVEQACVATLEPVAQEVDVPLALRILPDGTPPTDDDPDSPDEIESEGGVVDLGEAVAEQLALALDPYPRAPGAEIELPDDPLDAPAAKPNPFAALARLKRG